MQTFKDNQGKAWTVELNIAVVKRIRALLKIDLLRLTEGAPSPLVALFTDVIIFCDVLYVALKDQADEAKISDEDFGKRLGGDAVSAAHDAFLGELADFFLRLRQPAMTEAINKERAVLAKAGDRATERIRAMDPETLVSAVMSTSGPPSGAAPESSGSPQTP